MTNVLGSNENFVYLTCSNAKKETLHVYDWNLRLVKSIGQSTNSSEPFYFPTNDEKVKTNNQVDLGLSNFTLFNFNLLLKLSKVNIFLLVWKYF